MIGGGGARRAGPEAGVTPGKVALVLGTAAGGMGAHVRMLAQALARRGIAVDVSGPAATDADFGFGALPGVRFTPVEFGNRPRFGDVSAVLRLRRLLAPGGRLLAPGGRRLAPCGRRGRRLAPRGGAPGDGLDVVHAHGMRAGALAAIALTGRRGPRPRLVVTVHNAPPAGGGASHAVYAALERVVARRADLVLCVSGDLERRMRAAGARRTGRAIVPAPGAAPAAGAASSRSVPWDAGGRPVVLGVGRLTAQKGFGTLLKAAVAWRDLVPRPLVVIAGDGPEAGELRSQAGSFGIEVVFLGRRDDVPALLAAAAVFVLPSVWEGQPLVVQEALRAGVPIVASRAGGIPDLTGDAALLVPPGEPGPLGTAVRTILRDPAVAARLRAAARERAATLPTEEDAVTAVLASYATALA